MMFPVTSIRLNCSMLNIIVTIILPSRIEKRTTHTNWAVINYRAVCKAYLQAPTSIHVSDEVSSLHHDSLIETPKLCMRVPSPNQEQENRKK